MDLLDPLKLGEEEDKVMLHGGLDIEEHSMGSEDDPQVEHLSPQTLLETPHEDVQYSFRSADGSVSYGVLKVEDDNVPQIITSGNFVNTGVQQVITSSLNGPVYVIPNEVFVTNPTMGTRTIAPRSAMMDNAPVTTNIKRRDERRRATHNEVERRRRDKINNWITRLSKIIPENTSPDMKGNGHYDGQSKGGILAKACEYILELRECQEKMEACLKENKQLMESTDELKQKNQSLDRENRALREILKRNGIEVKDITC